MLKFDANGLMPAIVQDAETGQVRMLGYVNGEALARTFTTGDVWFYSRSRAELWHKGDTSVNFLRFVSMSADCDGDAVLIQARPDGPTCHTGADTCFHNEVSEAEAPEVGVKGAAVLAELFGVIAQRRRDLPEGSYTASLFKRGTPRIAQKVIEEGGETALAAMGAGNERVVSEMADLWYHCLVLLADQGLTLDDVYAELARRRV
ncbi:MAG: bifunctional phosphoribosyl-AMP cyclohydrolase/phosphoribosyl-ATP diphosphatase HisIE [Chloroflexi bacterium]|nr:bifunctional phosphoribosyl-AMP cyclohydrolase/phosphoribosyl-ATP diphosphatase HisIE [Chloroflexota bacterium]